jgi:thiosulfate/3-mercaptopyruvate sulfurtransferase
MNQYADPSVLVDTTWVANHLDDPQVRIIDIHLDPAPYEAGHIPGALFWNGMATLLHDDWRANLDEGAIGALLGESGISKDTTIVAYSDHAAAAPWLFWFLKTMGHDDVRVLNGGRKKWVAKGRRLTTDLPGVSPVAYTAKSPDPTRRAFLDQVQAAVGHNDQVLIDVRKPEEWRGEIFMLEPPQGTERGGHIPGAVHLYYEETLNDDGTFKSVEDLTSLFGGLGITADKKAITYCAVGMRAAQMWFVLKHLLGFPEVLNYDGSWNEWGRLADTSIEV